MIFLSNNKIKQIVLKDKEIKQVRLKDFIIWDNKLSSLMSRLNKIRKLKSVSKLKDEYINLAKDEAVLKTLQSQIKKWKVDTENYEVISGDEDAVSVFNTYLKKYSDSNTYDNIIIINWLGVYYDRHKNRTDYYTYLTINKNGSKAVIESHEFQGGQPSKNEIKRGISDFLSGNANLAPTCIEVCSAEDLKNNLLDYKENNDGHLGYIVIAKYKKGE